MSLTGTELVEIRNVSATGSPATSATITTTQDIADLGAVQNNQAAWASYADTQYTSGSPFLLTADMDTILPNNGASAIINYAQGFTLYNTSNETITGIEGESRLVTLDMQVLPTEVGTTIFEIWFDIGGSVGELYRRFVSFPKGNGVVRPTTLTTYVYTLDTWQANGAKVYVRANGTTSIYNIRYIIGRP